MRNPSTRTLERVLERPLAYGLGIGAGYLVWRLVRLLVVIAAPLVMFPLMVLLLTLMSR